MNPSRSLSGTHAEDSIDAGDAGDAIDVVVLGAGIVGLATAHALLRNAPASKVVIIDKEPEIAYHQTGRNSGVIHSGIYYKPGSDKSTMVSEGRRLLLDLIERHDIPHEMCGKVVVAIDNSEIPRLDALERLAADNRTAAERIDGRALREIEPHVAGVAALHVPGAGIVDYSAVCRALVADMSESGAELRLGVEVTGATTSRTGVVVHSTSGDLLAGSLINCTGLHSDRVAASTGADTDNVRIMPFRGEYYELKPSARHLVNHLVYPLPDPTFPFLGVHLTRMIDGSIHAGPNAVPAFSREGYRWRDVSFRDTTEMVFATRSWRLARRYWRTGLGEIQRSMSRRAFLTALQRLCPELTAADIEPSAAGVRAQAIDVRGQLLDDFAFAAGPRAIHVINAPSPAATASLAIGRAIAQRHDEMIDATS